MNKKAFTQPLRAGAGFTLLELVVVLIILGVLATLGLTQYGRMMEKARGAEARMILGDMRKLAAAYRLANGTINGATCKDFNLGTAEDQIPQDLANCRSSHYFGYWVTGCSSGVTGDPSITTTAYRCTSGGKSPQGSAVYLRLEINLLTGQDTWSSSGGY